MKTIVGIFLLIALVAGCNWGEPDLKGFQVKEIALEGDDNSVYATAIMERIIQMGGEKNPAGESFSGKVFRKEGQDEITVTLRSNHYEVLSSPQLRGESEPLVVANQVAISIAKQYKKGKGGDRQ